MLCWRMLILNVTSVSLYICSVKVVNVVCLFFSEVCIQAWYEYSIILHSVYYILHLLIMPTALINTFSHRIAEESFLQMAG